MILTNGLIKTYHLGDTVVTALKRIDLSVTRGEFVAIAGPSGSGKSTLLNLLGCVEPPTAGSLQIDNQEITSLSSNALADLRAERLGFVFQTFNLLSVMNVFENVEYPLQLRKIAKAERTRRTLAAIADVGLTSFIHHRPAQLSGGQRQRVAIARALVGSPALILADEPTANLDHATALGILNLLKDLHRKTQVTMLLTTHDPKIMQMADRIVEIMDGEIIKDSACM